MVEGLPSGVVGVTFPVVVMTIGVEMVPNGAAGIIVAVVPGVDAERVLRTVDNVGTGIEVTEGDGRAGSLGGCGAGMVVPGTSDAKDVAGCADSARIGVAVLPGGGVEDADVVGGADIDGVVPIVPAIGEGEVTGAAGVPGAIWPAGVEQVTTVPGIVGSEASGTGANVVPGAPGWVATENGLGPLSGDVTIVPGVDERPMAVVPMVETCARLALQPNSRAAANKRRMAIASSVQDLACLRLTHRDLAAFRQVDHRIKDDQIARLDAVVHFDFRAEVTRDSDLLQMSGAILDDGDMQAVLIEYNRIGRYDHGWCLARDEQLDGAIDPGTKRAVRIGNVDLCQQRSAAGLQRTRYARDLAGKAPIRNFGDTDHRVDTGSKPKGFVLGHEHLGADHVRVHQRVHEGRS
jgi:hypothetical protein